MVSKVKAGSYSVIAIAPPAKASARYSIQGCEATAHSMQATAPSSEPSVITRRPRPRSMAAPTA
ncbi:MAG: hypothetical protein IPL57_17345 [Rubrivivax sp.]|nr:hypothetical protein [Rubrivivax sp.]